MTTTELKDPAATQNDESQNTTASTKKRGTRTDVGLQQQQQDQETFYKNLIAFNERRNTPIVRMPKISGEDVDLHKLYTEVISRGGWLKVNARNDWEDVLYDLGISTKCVNGVVALKQIYCRYLDKYEKFYYLNEDPDRPDEPDDDDRQSRHKKWSEKATPIVPMSYNYLQHNVTEQTRIANKMSTDLYKNSEYEKLLLSLMSPLPNDQDFAINVCTLMANESKHTLRIENCPKLLDALIAHAGVFCHSTMRQLFEEYYIKTRKYSLQAFWNDLLYKTPQILELSYEDNSQTNNENLSEIKDKRKNQIDSRETFEDGLNADFDENIEMDSIDFNTLEFLSLGRGLGTCEYIGQRVQQVSSIMRNLSFFEENIVIMAKNRTFIRFLVMCSNIRWGNLHHMALDICGNIATELDLFDPTTDDLTRCLISTLCEGIESQDRGVIISCLEILNKLSQRDTNEDYLLKCLNQKLYNHICLYLSLNDIMLLLYTLECIYSLSSLGSTPCNAFVQVKGIIDTLVSLITVEAQSYGPDGCILMRVVETVPGNMLPMVAQNIANLQNVSLAHIKQPQQQPLSVVQTESPQKVPNISQTSASANSSVTPTPQQQISGSNILPKPSLPVQPTATQENEQFAISWLTATLENAPPITNRIEQHELFKLYTAALAKNGKRGSVPQTHFPRIVRSIFGTNIGPTMLKVTDSKGVEINMFFYVNIKFRTMPLPLKGFPQASQPIQNQPQATQQNIQPSQTTQQHLINQTVQNKISNTNTTINQVTTQSTLQANSDLINNLNVEIKANQQNTSTPQQQIQQSQVHQQQNLQIQQPQVQINQSQSQFQQQNQQQLQFTIQQKSQQQQPQLISQSQMKQQQSTTNSQKLHQNQIIKSQVSSQMQPQKHFNEMNYQQPQQKMIGNVIITQHSGQVVTKTTTIGQTQMTTTTHVPSSAGGSTAIIKSLLANKVTTASNNNITCSKFTTAPTTQISGSNGSMSATCAVVKETIASAVNTNNPSYLITQNVNLHQLAQRQQTLAKQKEITNQLHGTSVQINNIGTSQKLSTTTISALVNNPIIQSTPVKVGQTTIKPINPHTMEKKITTQVPIESMDNTNWEPLPPLAPLGGGATVRSIIVPASSLSTASEDSCNSVASSALSASHVLLNDDGENSLISFDGLLIPKSKSAGSSIMEDDSSKDSTIKGSQFINANKMLVNLLDKKSPDPPALTVGIKRKLMEDNKIRKKQLIITQIEESESQITPSKNAANLYAEMAASILEDEDLDDVIPTSKMSINNNTNSTIQTMSNIVSHKQQISQQQQQHHQQQQQQQQQQKQIQLQQQQIQQQLQQQQQQQQQQQLQQQQQQQIQQQQQQLQQQQQQIQQQQQQQLQQQQQQQLQQQQHQQQLQQQQQQQLQQQHQLHQQQQSLQTVIQKPQEPQKQIITMPLHRQIIVSPNVSNQQVILSQNPITVQASQQSQQTITTSSYQQAGMKNDLGLQTVPQTHSVILQKQIGPGGQQILQPVLQQQPQTQYVLATNQQGQHYLVAQPTHSQAQPTVLLTQNQQNAPTKTIIILQQQGAPPQAVGQQQLISGGPGQPPKMITTNLQGQQMILTQVPRPQILLSQGGNVLPQNVVLTTQTVLPQTSQPQTTIQQIQQAAQQSQLSPRFHIQQTILNPQNQTQGLVPQLTSNGSTLQIQQQTPQQQQASILSQLPQIPATIKLHTPASTASIINKSMMQQQNMTTKVINKPATPTISIVAQNPVTTQSNSMQPQIIQQMVKTGEKNINSSLAKVTLQQQPQTHLPSQITKTQILTQQQPQIQKTQSIATIIQKPQTIQAPTQLIQQQKLQQPTQNQIINSQPIQQIQSSQNQITVQQQPIEQQKPQQSPLRPMPNQHQNIMQQILAQNPSQTQIIQQSPAIQTSNSSIITTQTKPVLANQNSQLTNSNQQIPINSNSNQQTNVNSNSNHQNNILSTINQQSNLPSHQQNGQTQNQTQQSQSTQNNSNNSNSSTRSENSNSTNNTSNISNMANSSSAGQPNSPAPPPPPPPLPKNKTDEDIADINYVYVCDWRNCPRKKYKSVQEIYKHACQVHCPEGLDPGAEIYCQWGPGPGFCDNIPRKRFSLMTHLLDRHCTQDSMKAAVQRRLVMGIPQPTHANPVTIIKSNEARGSTASPALSTSSSGSAPSGAIISAAMHAIKRHSTDFINPKELMDENEGPVTKSIRLTAALILRNLVTYTDKAKRHIRQHEPHLAGVALSNVESSRTISQILYELNN